MSRERPRQTRVKRQKPRTRSTSVRVPSAWLRELIMLEDTTLLDVSSLVRAVAHAVVQCLPSDRKVNLDHRKPKGVGATLTVSLLEDTLTLGRDRISDFSHTEFLRFVAPLTLRAGATGGLTFPLSCQWRPTFQGRGRLEDFSFDQQHLRTIESRGSRPLW